jgi:nucleoside-diphosphate-sugar epimerase
LWYWKVFNEWQAQDYIAKYGMSITGVRPANVTGPDKVRGSVDHVQCITLPARGKPVRFAYKDAEVFVRVLLADAPRYAIYNSGGTPMSLGKLADMVRGFLPEAHIHFDHEQGGHANSGNYLIDNRRLLEEFEIEYPPFRQRVLQIINDIRQEEGLPLIHG